MTLFNITFSYIPTFFICAGIALLLGAPIAFSYTVKNKFYTKSFVLTIFVLPVAIMTVLMLVGNQLGAAVTIAGALALVRFRSLPATAKELVNVLMAMIVGVAVSAIPKNADILIVAVVFTVIVCAVNVVFAVTHLGESRRAEKTLRITIPETLDYNDVFEDLFEKYTARHELVRVKTTNMGSMFQLTYEIVLKDSREERAMINDLRCRNGNLDIICAKVIEDGKTL